MKRTVLLLCCTLLLATSFSQNQWQWLNPKPTGFTCLKIVFTDRQKGFILNYNGDLLRTSDQGSLWQVTDNFPGSSCMDIADSTGVIAGNNGALSVSTDNGSTWQTMHTGISDQFQYVSIVSRDTFFLANSSGKLYRTADRGKTWTNLTCHSTINCICFINSKTGFAGASGSAILKTDDGGVTWTQKLSVNYFPSGILSFQFLTRDSGYAFREYNDLLVTYDGGNTWTAHNASMTMPVIDFVNTSIGYLAGEDGALYRTGDSGVHWTSVTPSKGFIDGYQLYSLAFLTADTGFAVGMLGRILKTTNGGQSWTAYAPTYTPVTTVSFPTPATGYFTTWNNVYKTTDSGHTWHMLNLTVGTAYASSSRFEQAHFVSADTGFLVSNYSVQVYRTTDGGQTWVSGTPTPPYGYDDAPGISFLNSRTGFLALESSGNALMLKTKDGGASWATVWQPLYQGQYFTRIFYTDEATGYGIRYEQLYKTTDSSKTWTPVYTANYASLNDVCFTNKQTGFLTDDAGGIFVTHNAG